MDNYIQGRQAQLTAHGEYKGQSFDARHQVVKSTLFFNAGGQLVKTKFFKDSDTPQCYQEGSFPNGAVAQDIMAIKISPIITFNVGANVKTLGSELQRFYDDSFIEFTLQKKEVSKVWLSSLMPQGFSLNPDPTVGPAPLISHEKVGEWMQLRAPIEVGANKSFDITFNPADSLNLPAYDALLTPHLPLSGLANSEHGYCIRLFLDTIEYMVAG